MMGIPLEKSAWMLGDNSSVITSSTIPSLSLKKRHKALSYYYVRSNIVYGLLKFCYVGSKENVEDTYTKFLPFNDFGP